MKSRAMTCKNLVFLFLFAAANVWFSSAALANPADSLRVKNLNGKQFIMHKVDPAENWTKLSNRYGCTITELQKANPGVEMLKIGQIVHVPLKTNTAETIPATQPASPKAQDKTKPLLHKVTVGETLFGIAKKYEVTVEQIKEYNQLSSDGIQPGRELIVGYQELRTQNVIAQSETKVVVVPPQQPASGSAMASTNSKSLPAAESNKESVTKTVAAPAAADVAENSFEKATRTLTTLKSLPNGKSTVQVVETGVATWIQDGTSGPGKYYGLHRTAPIGTIIKVTNRMNNQFVYVKIVGVLPDSGENENVIIKLSQAVSEKLNVLDPIFRVELSYGMVQ